MTFIPPPEVARLRSLREVVSWAIGAFAPPATLAEVDAQVSEEKKRRASDGLKIDYGGCPGHDHARWFLRMGLMEVSTVEEAQRLLREHPDDGCPCACHEHSPDRRTRPASFTSCTIRGEKGCFQRWNSLFHEATKATTFFESERRYKVDVLCRGAHIPDEVRDWIERDVFPDEERRRRALRDRRVRKQPFDASGVLVAIAATRPREHGATLSLAVHPPPRNDLAPERLRIVLREAPLVRTLTAGRPRLVSGRDGDVPEVTVAPDGGVLAHHVGAEIRVARVNRVTGEAADWPAPVSVAELPAGRLLAVDRAGDRALSFVWAASGVGTQRYRAEPGSAPVRGEHLAAQCAAAAVLDLDRILLAFPNGDGPYLWCAAFPELALTSLVAARGQGQTLVLATGFGPDGRPQTWVECTGATRAHTDGLLFLQLSLGRRIPPKVVDGEGSLAVLSSEPATVRRHQHGVPRAEGLRRDAGCVDSADRQRAMSVIEAARGERGRP